jgi:ribonuclease HII
LSPRKKDNIKPIDMWEHERIAQEQGFCRIAGVDEAGRGPLAGPIVAAAVILLENVPGLNDSKQLTELQRESLYEQLVSGVAVYGIACIEPQVIDKIRIQAANFKVMADAVAQLAPQADYLLVDGFALPGVVQPALKLIKGDARSASIAAASILAKVTRDRMMVELDKLYPQYGFARHKGYGTQAHMAALEEHGPCPAHRRSFAPLSETIEPRMLV